MGSDAAAPAVNLESERGTLTAPAVSVTDPTASGNAATKFAQAAQSSPVPLGVAGTWTLKFDDEFNGSRLDTSKWNAYEGRLVNKVTAHASNVSFASGSVILTLASSSSGAVICTCNTSTDYMLPVGGYAEARVYFPGDGSSLYNWPAWWASGPNWPAAGEHDIAEVLGGPLTVNYHSPSGSHNQGAVSGYWGDAYHVYGLYRKANSAEVYWDGKLVKSYSTDDNGAGESLILNIGYGSRALNGPAGAIKVDYVRAWQ